jgi:integrase
LSFLPASPSTVSIYLTQLIQNKCSVAVLNSAVYSIQWVHDKNLFKNPCSDALVRMVSEGGKRIIAKPFVNKKEPINVEMLSKIFEAKNNVQDLSHLRIRTIFLLGFVGFFRCNEMCNIRRSDISFHPEHVEINVRQSKTDIFRKGNVVSISKTNSYLCPVSCLKSYIELAGISDISDEFIFRSIRFFKKSGIYRLSLINKPISYTTVRELILSTLEEIGEDSTKFGVHSLRSGGATAAANNNVSDRLFKCHGRWRSENAKDGYVKDSLVKKLSVTKQLGL